METGEEEDDEEGEENIEMNGGDTTIEYSYHEEYKTTKLTEHRSSRRKSWMEGTC